MVSNHIKIKVKVGVNEIEIEGNSKDVERFLNFLLPIIKHEVSGEVKEGIEEEVMPTIKVSEKEPVSEIITKLFSTSWAKKPRSLSDVINALSSLGLYYQKSTIAVNLKRLVQRGKLRRIKSKDGTFLYVPSKPSVE